MFTPLLAQRQLLSIFSTQLCPLSDKSSFFPEILCWWTLSLYSIFMSVLLQIFKTCGVIYLRKMAITSVSYSCFKQQTLKTLSTNAVEPRRTHAYIKRKESAASCWLAHPLHTRTSSCIMNTNKHSPRGTHVHADKQTSAHTLCLWLAGGSYRHIMVALSPCFPPGPQQQPSVCSCQATLFVINLFRALVHFQQVTQSIAYHATDCSKLFSI